MSYDPAQDEEDRREREEMDRYHEEVEMARMRYRAEWPDHCTECGGWGLVSWTEAHGERFEEPCSECVEQGICPRCGLGELLLDDEGNVIAPGCEACGWLGDEGMPNL